MINNQEGDVVNDKIKENKEKEKSEKI